MIDLELVESKADERELRGLIEKHLALTESPRARAILDNWGTVLPRFVKVFPMEYKRVLGQLSREDEATEREEVLNT